MGTLQYLLSCRKTQKVFNGHLKIVSIKTFGSIARHYKSIMRREACKELRKAKMKSLQKKALRYKVFCQSTQNAAKRIVIEWFLKKKIHI